MKKLLSILIVACIALTSFFNLASCIGDISPNSAKDDSNSDKNNSKLPNVNNNSGNGTLNETEKNNENKHEPEEPIVYSEGLAYSLSEDRTYLIVEGMGTCRDKKVVIPPSYNDVPIKAIGLLAFGGGTLLGPDAPLITEIIIPDSVTEIARGAFANNTYLTKITFGKSVSTIQTDAFYGCKNIKEVHISDLKSWCNITFESNSSTPFYYSSIAQIYINNIPVTEIVIPNDITEIKRLTFSRCRFLKKVTIGDSVSSISGAFSYCSNLTEIKISDSVTNISTNAFIGCSLLMKADFEDPEGWKCIYYDGTEVNIEKSDLSVSTTAAAYLANTYSGYNWVKE